MNTINLFNSKKQFPLSTQAIDFVQSMIKQAYKFAFIGGSDNYILTGCEQTTGNNWASGYVVINGELLPFMGGTGTAAVRIKETKTDVVAGYDTYAEAYTTRVVEFGSNVGGVDTFTWNTFTRLKSNTEIVRDFATKAELDAVRLLVMPRGAIMDFDLINNPLPLPTGWMFCNGATLDGYGKLPDKRGRVSIGYNPASNNLPDNVVDGKEENYGTVGNTGGKPLVSLTEDEGPTHTHGVRKSNDSNGTKLHIQMDTDETIDGDGIKYIAGGTTPIVAPSGLGESHENRMPYVVSYFIVKVV